MTISDNARGLALAVASSVFIGASFILKKKGLKHAGVAGTRAGSGGYAYLLEPLWWAGMLTMLVGEVANFVAYIFAPAVLVTPLGALSIIVRSILQVLWMKFGCLLLNQTNILVYLGICSLVGSLTVVSIKAVGIAIKLTLEGKSQVAYPQTWFFVAVTLICVITQLNYLNKALDTFNTAIVSPIYYVMFTTLTIVASIIMFKDWAGQDVSSIASELCGFMTVLCGTILLHTTREQEAAPAPASISWYICRSTDDLVKNIEDDHFVILLGPD